jgi:CubicO group peptidase (beta-lactamase class C family)
VNLLELTRQMAEAPAPLQLAPAQNAMTATQDDDPPPPPPPSPKPIPANPPTERPVPEMTSPVPGAPIRGQDPTGAGQFGAGRGTRTHSGVDSETDDGHIVRMLYASPNDGLKPGTRVEKGETQIGRAQDLHQSHDKRMTNHIHMEVHRPAERPEGRGRPSRNYIDPSPYVGDR